MHGNLSSQGERIALAMPDQAISTNSSGGFVTNTIYILVDEVNYGTGGRWGQWSDGGGSSLELINARSDHRLAPNWADSDETAKSGWTNVEWTGVLDNGNGAADSFHVFLQGAGECLVDNVEVFASGGPNLISNSDFQGDLTGWFPQGTQSKSTVDSSGGYGGTGKCLHVRASGRGDTGANRVRTALSTTLNAGQTVTLRAKVRWLKGNPEILLRLHGNWLEAPGNIVTARNLGTPGAANSRAAANVGPAISEVSHSPVLPTANQAVTVRARVTDPDGLATLTLNYRVDPSTNVASVSMINNGAGLYSATLPGQPSGTVVAFYVKSSDGGAGSVSTRFPSDAPTRECLVRFGETQAAGTFAAYRLWLTQATISRWSSREKNSNEPLDATFVYNNFRPVYNIGTLYSGSPWHTPGYNSPLGNMCDYVATFPDDDPLLGANDFVLATVGNLGNDASAQREQAAFWMLNQMGVQSNYRRYFKMFVNGQQRGAVFEDSQQPSSDIVKQWFPNDDQGDLHKIEDWFEFDNSGDVKLFNVDATLQNFTTTGGAKKLARYRWCWRKRAVKDSANAYYNLFDLVDAVNNPNAAAYTQQTEALVDVEQWMRVFCIQHVVGNWDAYSYARGKNMYAYKPREGKWQMWSWDIDFVLGSGSDGPQTDMFGGVNDPTISRMLNHPPFRRAYYRAMEDAVNGPLLSTKVNPVLDARYAALTANGVSVENPSATKTWIQDRRNYIIATYLNQVAANFAITSNSGNNFSTGNNLVSLTGTAPVGVKTIRVNGIAYPPTWTTITNWTLQVPLAAGANALTINGYDLRGNLVSGASDTITVTYTGGADLPQAYLVINEIMYNPALPDASFVEIHNTSPDFTFPLSNYRLEGADFTFPEGTIIGPGGFLVVANNLTAFTSAYGSSIPIAGIFDGTLDNDGETLSLIQPGSTPEQDVIIDQVRYEGGLPWPAAANGTGPSLQLIDPSLDNSRVANWDAIEGSSTPPAPQWTFVSVTGSASSSSLYVYLTSAGNVHIDDLSLVAGSQANVGANLLQNGAFDANLNGWTVSANHSQTVIDTAVKRSGAGSLHLIASSGGTTRNSSVWQDVAPALVQGNTYTLSYWYLPSSNGSGLTLRLSGNGIVSSHPIAPPTGSLSSEYTPGAVNSVRASLPVFPNLWINELQPSNVSGITDRLGEHDPWIELYNSGASAINLSGFYLTDQYTNLIKYPLPSINVNPGQYFVIWADGQPAQTLGAELHANFRLGSPTGAVALVYTLSNQPTVLDYANYKYVGNDRSYGSYPNGQSVQRQVLFYPTPGGTNNPASSPLAISINEWMASNTETLPDAADGQYDDWIELYNTSGSTVDLSGYFLTDNLLLPAQWPFPAGTTIGPNGYLLVWADNDTGQNGFDGDLHANFQLSKSGEAIGLFAPGGAVIDSVTFGAQTNDISQGRSPDGQPQIVFMPSPTPRSSNVGATGNNPPVLAAIANQTVNEGSLLAVTASASDPDAGDNLSFSLGAGAPTGASINAGSGLFTWTPTEAQGPNVYAVTVRVTDNGSPNLSATRSFSITVDEVNATPTLGAIGDQTVNEGTLVAFSASGSDSDVPPNSLIYSLEAGATAGATINPTSGAFTWTPTEAQGPGVYPIQVRVSDDGLPAASVTESFTVTVNEVNGPPVLAAIGDQSVNEGSPLTFTASAADGDIPAQALSYSLDAGAPAGATIDPATGAFAWTPTEAQGPSTNSITIRVTDSGTPNLSSTRSLTIVVNEVNTAPALSAVSDQTVDEGSALTFTATASDTDVPAQTLVFSLDAGAPAGATINPTTGAFAWTPTEAQGPSTNSITIRVADNGSGALSTTRTFTVIVNEVNAAPTLAVISDQAVGEDSLLTLTASASDPDLPAQSLTYSLGAGAPTGASINPNTGVFTWTPTEAQGPSTNSITVRVEDNGSPPQSDDHTFTVVVAEGNAPPVLAAIGNKSTGEAILLTFTATATDADSPNQSLSYSLDNGAPAGAAIDPTTGVFTWTPTEAQGPSTNTVIIRVTDNGTPPLADSESITVVVTEVNSAPSLTALSDHTVTAGATVSFTATATDSDLPANSVTYSLGSGAPAGAAIDPVTGSFGWTPSSAQAPSTNQVTVIVNDNGSPALTDSKTFQIVVNSASQSTFRITEIVPTKVGLVLTWSAQPGKTYRVECKQDLAQPAWTFLGEITATGDTASLTNPAPSEALQRYYRVLQMD